ncbi:MAG: sensor histidine kinase [Armatimonadota bacterium]|nr:sensor histidine kinase [Armatimonadota bacterium]
MEKPARRTVIARALDIGMRPKLLAVALAVVVISGAAAIVHTRLIVARVVGAQLDERVVHTAAELATRCQDAVLTNDTYALYELLRGAVSADRHIRYAFVLDRRRGALAHSFESGVPGDLLKLNRPVSQHASVMKIQTEEGVIRDAMAPIALSGGTFVVVGMNQRLLDRSVAYSSRILLASAVATSVVALILSYFTISLFLRPILNLRMAAQSLGEGNFGSRARIWWNDEIGYLAATFNDMAANLQRLYADIRQKEAAKTRLLRKIISAQEEERMRIARELHDETSQSLASVNVALGVILDGQQTEGLTKDLRSTISEALERIRNLAFELRPGLLDDLGLAPAIDRYVQDFEKRYGLPVDFHSAAIDGLRLRPEVETTAYRIVQEALVNSAKHARATRLSVTTKLNHKTLRVIVEDDGRGFDIENAGAGHSLGLFGMRERAELIGGSLKIDSTPGQGVTIALDVPLDT